jgi:single-strand DNA-binding protein
MSASNINVVVISGNLTRDPELRHLDSGTAVCKLRVAVNTRRKTQSGEWVDKPNYFDVTVWGGRGESCAEYLNKGSRVTIEGRLDWREWETQEGGKRQAVEIVAGHVEFGPKRQNGGDDGSGSSEATADNSGQLESVPRDDGPADLGSEPAADFGEDDIPF